MVIGNVESRVEDESVRGRKFGGSVLKGDFVENYLGNVLKILLVKGV